MTLIRSVIAVSILVALSVPVYAQDWHKSKWGEDDQIGAANYLSSDKVLNAASLIKTGKTYSLGGEVNRNTPAFGTRTFELVVIQLGAPTPFGPNKATFHDDMVQGWLGIGTQIDSFAHAGIDNVYYNGNKGLEFHASIGVTKLGIETIPPIVTRGVLLDMARHQGVEVVPAGTAFQPEDLDAAAASQGVEVREGDVVLLHTGWQSMVEEGADKFLAGEPGITLASARHLAGKGVVAIGADTWGVEVIPPEEGTGVFPVHGELLAKYGVYILENIITAELAGDEAYEFMFVLGQAKFSGAVQMIINPIAIR